MEGYYKPTKADLVKVAHTFADAFYDYPLHKYLLPDDVLRKKQHPMIGMVFATYGYKFSNLVATSENCEGIMLFASSPDGDTTTMQLVRSGLLKVLFTRWGGKWVERSDKVSKVSEKIRRKNAPDPHVYIWVLGVRPELQGKGYSRKLLAPLLKKADDDRVPCYLETFKTKNVAIYKRFGFEVVEECPVPETPLTLYSMLRKPSG